MVLFPPYVHGLELVETASYTMYTEYVCAKFAGKELYQVWDESGGAT
jgi:hypothetical protein